MSQHAEEHQVGADGVVPGRRVLVVDDCLDITSILSRMLQLAGFEVMTAADGSERSGSLPSFNRASLCSILDYRTSMASRSLANSGLRQHTNR